MARRRQNLKTVFVDSSVLFAAVCSPTGGSAKLFTLSKIQLIASSLVLTEVERNVRKKLQSYHLERFLLLVSKLEIHRTKINEKAIGSARKVIVQKDVAILADAKKVKASYLVSLDKKDFFNPEVAKFIRPGRIVTSGELIYLIENREPR